MPESALFAACQGFGCDLDRQAASFWASGWGGSLAAVLGIVATLLLLAGAFQVAAAARRGDLAEGLRMFLPLLLLTALLVAPAVLGGLVGQLGSLLFQGLSELLAPLDTPAGT